MPPDGGAHCRSVPRNGSTQTDWHGDALNWTDRFEQLIRRDPGRRGLIGPEPESGSLCPGHLAEAAQDLADHGRRVGIVTGFFVPHADPPAAETDGPPGAALLAAALKAVGIEVGLLTDAWCAEAVAAAARAFDLPSEIVMVCPQSTSSWRPGFLQGGWGSTLSHLIAVERVGPGHTVGSLLAQPRRGPAPRAAFSRRVPEPARNRCHNLRGECIDNSTADLHEFFEAGRIRHAGIRTIGIGDGGNEIGMGTIPWEELCRRFDGRFPDWIPCRVATDWTIIGGTSNWGAQALAAAVLILKGATPVLRPWGRHHQYRQLKHMVEAGPAVDGITARPEPTVDGLPFLTYIQPWEGIRRTLGLRD